MTEGRAAPGRGHSGSPKAAPAPKSGPAPKAAPALKNKAAPAPKRKRSGPGRPEGVSHIRDDILDAAEMEFANQGYSGTSLRTVAEKAQVTQALINYYFGSKKGLFKEAFLRRAVEIAADRERRLDALMAGGAKPEVRDILGAFLQPALTLRNSPGGRVFMRLHARLHTEPPEISYELRSSAYDRSTHLFADALSAALPELPRKDIYWRVTFMVGAYLYTFSDTHRVEELAPGICDPGNPDEILNAITTFITGGMLAPPASLPAQPPARRRAPSNPKS